MDERGEAQIRNNGINGKPVFRRQGGRRNRVRKAKGINALRFAECGRGIARRPAETDGDGVPTPFLQEPERKFPRPKCTRHIDLVRVFPADRPAAVL